MINFRILANLFLEKLLLSCFAAKFLLGIVFFLLKILFLLHLKTRPSKTQLFAIMKNYSIRPKWRANDSKMPKIQMPKSTYHSGTHNYKIFLQTLRSKVLRLSCKCENTPTYFALGTTINNKNYLFSLFCFAWIWRYKNENSILRMFALICTDIVFTSIVLHESHAFLNGSFLAFSFYIFVFSKQSTVNVFITNFCQWLDSNFGPQNA